MIGKAFLAVMENRLKISQAGKEGFDNYFGGLNIFECHNLWG